LFDLLPLRWKERIYLKSCGGYVGRDAEYVEALNVDFAKVDMVVVKKTPVGFLANPDR